jgi:Kef-type K+ transport system membrane component KefB
MALVKRLDAAHSSAGVVPALVIAIVLLFSAFAKAVGVPEVLGGFVAGLAFSRRFFLPFGRIVRTDLPLATRIEHETEPIIQILTPIFFVSVGLSVDLRALDLTTPQVWTLCFGLFVAALVGKLLSALTIGPGAGSRLLIGVSMVPRGEVGLIFADLGRDARVLDASQYAALIVVIVLTTVLPPLILPTIARSEAAAQASDPGSATPRR